MRVLCTCMYCTVGERVCVCVCVLMGVCACVFVSVRLNLYLCEAALGGGIIEVTYIISASTAVALTDESISVNCLNPIFINTSISAAAGSSASRPLRQQILTVQVENSTIDTSTTYLLAVHTLRSVPLCIRPPQCRLHDDGRSVRQSGEGVREKSGSDSAKLWRMKMPSFCQQGCERRYCIYLYTSAAGRVQTQLPRRIYLSSQLTPFSETSSLLSAVPCTSSLFPSISSFIISVAACFLPSAPRGEK